MLRKSNTRTALAILHDTVATILAWIGAYLLRFNFELPPNFATEIKHSLLWVVLLQMAVFWKFGLYRGIWRYASLNDLRRIALAVLFAAATIPFVLWMLRSELVVPRSVLVLDPLLLILAMGGSRLLYRMWKENGLYGRVKLSGEPVLVLGAGDAGVVLSKDLEKNPSWK
ncbi:MAG: polysaccharide biosynthesis protein, partial [Gallionella sp.]|nr:polysaccharide biosynthesis protein [Gallionella sp.]